MKNRAAPERGDGRRDRRIYYGVGGVVPGGGGLAGAGAAHGVGPCIAPGGIGRADGDCCWDCCDDVDVVPRAVAGAHFAASCLIVVGSVMILPLKSLLLSDVLRSARTFARPSPLVAFPISSTSCFRLSSGRKVSALMVFVRASFIASICVESFIFFRTFPSRPWKKAACCSLLEPVGLGKLLAFVCA